MAFGSLGDGDGLVEQVENAFGGGHGGLQDVEFFAEVLNGAEETLRVMREGDEDADGERAGESGCRRPRG